MNSVTDRRSYKLQKVKMLKQVAVNKTWRRINLFNNKKMPLKAKSNYLVIQKQKQKR